MDFFLPSKYKFPLAYHRQWHLHGKSEVKDFDIRSSVNCDKAWEFLNGWGSDEPVIAITDDGCKLDHASFNVVNTIRDWGYFDNGTLITSKKNYGNRENMFSPGFLHGSSCSGLIAAHPHAGLTVGVSPNVGLIPIKLEKLVTGSLDITESIFAQVLDFIEDKVDILINPWSSIPSWSWSESIIERIQQLANKGGRRGRGILFIWPAGNSNCPINFTSPVSIPYKHYLTFDKETPLWGLETAKIFSNPMIGLDNSIIVSGVNSQARRAHFSCYGFGIDICAPCNNTHTYNRMLVEGAGITTITGISNNITNHFKGTSASAAIVAGIASLILSVNKRLKATDIKKILLNSAIKDLNFMPYPPTPPTFFDPDTSWDVSPVAPFDIPDFNHFGWSPWFGYGKADAYQAVKMAASLNCYNGNRF